MEEIVTMGESGCLKVNSQERRSLLKMVKRGWWWKNLQNFRVSTCHRASTEEEEDKKEASSDVIKSFMKTRNGCQDFFKKHHSNIIVMNGVEFDEW